MSTEMFEKFQMPKKTVTRLFVGALVAFGAGLALGFAALWAALASDAIDVGGSNYVDGNGGSGAWTALALVVVGSLAILGGSVAAVVSWIGALLNTWQLEDKVWFGSLLALGLLGFGVVAMIAYVVAGPDGTKHGVARAESRELPGAEDRTSECPIRSPSTSSAHKRSSVHTFHVLKDRGRTGTFLSFAPGREGCP